MTRAAARARRRASAASRSPARPAPRRSVARRARARTRRARAQRATTPGSSPSRRSRRPRSRSRCSSSTPAAAAARSPRRSRSRSCALVHARRGPPRPTRCRRCAPPADAATGRPARAEARASATLSVACDSTAACSTHFEWLLPLLALAVCGLGIAHASTARRYDARRRRAAAARDAPAHLVRRRARRHARAC